MNTVYLLCAGASYNAIPILNQLSKSIRYFLRYLEESIKIGEIHEYLKQNWIPLLELAAQHTSIDTYAKKLYLTEDFSKLQQLKYILSAYFIYEQCDIVNNYVPFRREDKTPYPNTPLDPRYDYFMAALLKKSESGTKLPENLRIVSWNYDSQLEMAYHTYSSINHNDDKSLRKQLGIFPLVDQDYNVNDDRLVENCRIVKLNGTATNLLFEKEQSFHISSNRRLHNAEAIAEIKSLIITSMRLDQSPEYKAYGANINFAWELKENWYSEMAVEAAKAVISEASTLVVIGYSFPVFNRDIDKYIFEENKLEKIYIQDLPHNIEGVKSRVIKTIDADPEIIELETSVDQFLIPFEV